MYDHVQFVHHWRVKTRWAVEWAQNWQILQILLSILVLYHEACGSERLFKLL